MSSTATIKAGNWVNATFLIAASGGFAATVVATPGVYEAWTFAPTAMVIVYALAVSHIVTACNDRTFAEHAIDSVYYLGFMFTLFALIVLFATVGHSSAGGRLSIDLVSTSMTYIGISVTTSLAGVLLRSMVRGRYLRKHPERTADTIESFLSERAAITEALAEREHEYLTALEQYISATTTFSQNLAKAQDELTIPIQQVANQVGRQVTSLEELEAVQQRLVQTTDAIHRKSTEVPWSEVGTQMNVFRTKVSDLNAVVDGLVAVLETKVERIK